MSEMQRLLKVSHASFVATYPELEVVEYNPMGAQLQKTNQLPDKFILTELIRWREEFNVQVESISRVNIKTYLIDGEEVVVSLRLIKVKSDQYVTCTIINSLESPDVMDISAMINNEIDQSILFSKVFKHSPIGLVLIDQNQVLYKANKYIFKYFGFEYREIIGERFGNVFSCATVQGSHKLCGTTIRCRNCMLKNGIENVLTENKVIENVELSHEFKIKGVEVKKWFTVSISPVIFDEETYALVSFVDITHRVETEEELRVLGITDGLTALSNRHHIISILESALEQKRSKSLTVALIDLDDFKHINEHYGHLIGDDLLVLFGEVLKLSVRLNDYVGRYGGEEFLIVFFDTGIDETMVIIDRIRMSLTVQSENLLKESTTFSCGLVEVKPKNRSIVTGDVLSTVDKLLQQAKHEGKNCTKFGEYK